MTKSLSDPYHIDLPAVVSFSGGRTSGYMLYHILQAHGGQPDGLRVCFQNTGLEHAKTYEFIKACADNWSVNIEWLEYRVDADGNHAFELVDFDTASRKGEPFTTLIDKKGYLPNPVSRICTSNLKMRTLDRYLKTLPEFAEGYTNAVGLRADEPRRVHRIKSDNGREEMCCPLYHANVTHEDVVAWWSKQPFDLELPLGGNMAGNCVGCFLKGKEKIELLMKAMPEYFDWWIQAETEIGKRATTGGRFRSDRPSYEVMKRVLDQQGWLFDVTGEEEDTIPCMCTD